MYSYWGGYESAAIAYRAAVAAGRAGRGACRALQWLCRAGDCADRPRTGVAAAHRRPGLRPIASSNSPIWGNPRSVGCHSPQAVHHWFIGAVQRLAGCRCAPRPPYPQAVHQWFIVAAQKLAGCRSAPIGSPRCTLLRHAMDTWRGSRDGARCFPNRRDPLHGWRSLPRCSRWQRLPACGWGSQASCGRNRQNSR